MTPYWFVVIVNVMVISAAAAVAMIVYARAADRAFSVAIADDAKLRSELDIGPGMGVDSERYGPLSDQPVSTATA